MAGRVTTESEIKTNWLSTILGILIALVLLGFVFISGMWYAISGGKAMKPQTIVVSPLSIPSPSPTLTPTSTPTPYPTPTIDNGYYNEGY